MPPIILIYGVNGCGKTALVSQLTNSYVFDFDGGMKTAATLKDKFFTARQTVTFDVFKEPNPMKPVMYHAAMKKMKEIVQQCSERKWPYKACIIDSLTGMCTVCQLYVQSLGDKSNPQKDPMAKMEIQNWGSLVNEVTRFLLMIQSLQVPTIVTAHVDYIEKKKPGTLNEMEITDMFPSSATTKHGLRHVMSFFDEVWYAKAVIPGRKYIVDGKGSAILKARTRSSFDIVDHTTLGMVELLKKIGYDYGK